MNVRESSFQVYVSDRAGQSRLDVTDWDPVVAHHEKA